jgi:hypothetical protein
MQWITELQAQNIPNNQWDLLWEKFDVEGTLDTPITSIAHLSYDMLKEGFALKMREVMFVSEQLEIAGRKYGFTARTMGNGSDRKAKCVRWN